MNEFDSADKKAQVMLLTRRGSVRVSIKQLPAEYEGLRSEPHPTHTNHHQQSIRAGSLPSKENIMLINGIPERRPRSCKCKKSKKRSSTDFEKKGIIGDGGFGRVFLVVKKQHEN